LEPTPATRTIYVCRTKQPITMRVPTQTVPIIAPTPAVAHIPPTIPDIPDTIKTAEETNVVVEDKTITETLQKQIPTTIPINISTTPSDSESDTDSSDTEPQINENMKRPHEIREQFPVHKE
jgi:hypothetical protein